MSDSFERDREIIRQATPGPWEAKQLVGAGWEIFGVLPKGFQFDCTYHGADGETQFMLWHMHEQKMISFASERWVQFETRPWAEMQLANARLIAEARTRWPAALDRIAEQDAEIARLRAELTECRAVLLLAYGGIAALQGAGSELAKRIEKAATGEPLPSTADATQETGDAT